LSRWGKTVFEAGNYPAAIKFLEQAGAIQSSGVWQSSYPYLAGAYLMLNAPEKANAALDKMRAAITKPYGYLTHSTPLGFLLQSLGQVRRQLPTQYWGEWDKVIDQVLVAKSRATERENARPN
jgi:hypothetical protein